MTGEAMLRHGWWSLRGRFWIALVVVLAHAVIVAVFFGRYGGSVPAEWEMTSADRTEVEVLLGAPYGDYLRETWAGGGLGGLLAVLAVALVVGGVAAERRQGTADLTLSLPVSRSGWLLARAGLCMVLLFLLACVSAIAVAVGGAVTGAEVPLATAAAAVVLAGLGTAYVLAIGLAATTMTRDAIGAAVLALAVQYVLNGLVVPAEWHPDAMVDVRAWSTAAPWRSILAVSSLTGVFLLIGIRRFDAIDS